MEHPARRQLAFLLLLTFVLLCAAPLAHAAEPYFTISTYKTFAPGEKAKIHLYSRNVDDLEFRVYRIQDPEKFVSGLAELHSFNRNQSSAGPVEKIDEETWLERFHDWKRNLWRSVRRFLRTQLSHETRTALQEKQSSLAKRSRIVGVTQFAQIPLLNDKQLVARWRQEVPPTFVTDNQVLPIDPLPAGMYLVEATDAHLKAYTILIVSQTALITRTVAGSMLAYVVDRKSGAPVAKADVALSINQAAPMRAVTSQDGIAEFTSPTKKSSESDDSSSTLWAMARSGNDVALVSPWGSSFTQQVSAQFVSYVYTDRPVYRPGHTVHWKAILRQYAGDTLTLPHLSQVHVVISDGEDKSIFDKQLPISANGTLNGDIELPTGTSLGYYSINISDASDSLHARGDFRVEEYRKPEYQVRVSVAKPRVMQGETNQATIDSRYFFGEPVANAKVKYRIYQSYHYWWDEDADVSNTDQPEDNSEPFYGGAQEGEQTGRLGPDGKLTVSIPTRFIADQHHDKDYLIEAAVTDEAGREITGRYRFIATYGSFRVNVEPASYFIVQGQQASFRVTAVDYDDKPIQTRIHLHLVRRMWRNNQTQDTDAGSADATTGADGKATITLPINLSGSIIVTATADTPEKRTVQDFTSLYVSGNAADSFYSGDESQHVQIIADQKTYAPGDTAHLSIVGDIADFHALVTATGYTIEFRKVLTAHGTSLAFDLPITKDSQPNLTVDVVFLKDDQLYQARKSLKVPPVQQQLQVEITPASTVFQPQQSAAYDIVTRDSTGKAISAELSFGVVDEAIYSLYPDSSGDIVRALYPDRDIYPDVESSISYYFSGDAGNKSPLLAERHARYRPQLAQVKPGNDSVQPKIRKAFPDTATWQPTVHTDAQGHARVSLTFPDSLTTWRATVRAISPDSKAGSMVNRVIVRKNIIVRMGQPRFLRKGDIVSIPIIVHNYLADAKQVQLSLNATGIDIVSGTTQQVTVAAKGEATAIWKLRASAIGNAVLTAKAITNEESDALEITLPIKPSGVAQSITGSGVLTDSSERTVPLNFPANTDPVTHSITIEASPSIAGTLFNALDYLVTFPYGCTEQTMSSFLPNIIVAQAMQQLHLEGHVDQAALNTRIAAGLERLQDYRHDDGGWGWWKEDSSQVFMTAYVVSGLAQASQAGYHQADQVSRPGIAFLKQTLAKHPRMLPELRAYVVYALGEANEIDRSQLDILYNRRNDLSSQALAFTGLAMLRAKDAHATEITTLLESKARIQGDLASWPAATNPLLDIDYDSSAETTAFALKLILHADPQSPLPTSAAQWLVANRNEGYWWSSTQQTAFVIFGLTDYIAASHELTGESDVEVFINGTSTAKRHFTQADTLSGASLQVTIDSAHLQPTQNNIRIVTHGGRIYWSTRSKYFSTDKKSYQQGTMALNITRDYFRLVPQQKDGNIVYQLQPLSGPVEQGDVLAVHLAVAGSQQKYLLIEDPIPAGTEFIQNEESYNIVGRPNTWDWWYTRREFHDDRAALFSTDFAKRHESFYLLKVINPGSFAISPASVQPMYQPSVQATTDELHLDVKEVQ